jgi:hypothetical protein
MSATLDVHEAEVNGFIMWYECNYIALLESLGIRRGLDE